MQRRRMILAVLMIMVVGAVWTLQAQARKPQAGKGQAGKTDWVPLGQRPVTDKIDHDTITVTRAKGTFKAVKFEVQGHAVDFHRVVIHFANGADQKLELRNTIKAGGESRAIDIEGANRVIRSIDFWYDAKTLGPGGRSRVRVLGKH